MKQFSIEDYNVEDDFIEVSVYDKKTKDTFDLTISRKIFWNWIEANDYNAYYDLPDPTKAKYNARMDPRDPEYYTVDGAYCEEDFYQMLPEMERALEDYVNYSQR